MATRRPVGKPGQAGLLQALHQQTTTGPQVLLGLGKLQPSANASGSLARPTEPRAGKGRKRAASASAAASAVGLGGPPSARARRPNPGKTPPGRACHGSRSSSNSRLPAQARCRAPPVQAILALAHDQAPGHQGDLRWLRSPPRAEAEDARHSGPPGFLAGPESSRRCRRAGKAQLPVARSALPPMGRGRPARQPEGLPRPAIAWIAPESFSGLGGQHPGQALMLEVAAPGSSSSRDRPAPAGFSAATGYSLRRGGWPDRSAVGPPPAAAHFRPCRSPVFLELQRGRPGVPLPKGLPSAWAACGHNLQHRESAPSQHPPPGPDPGDAPPGVASAHGMQQQIPHGASHQRQAISSGRSLQQRPEGSGECRGNLHGVERPGGSECIIPEAGCGPAFPAGTTAGTWHQENEASATGSAGSCSPATRP